MGSWGHGPLDNDSASDWRWDIAEIIIEEINNKLHGDDVSLKYHAIGMWDFVRVRLSTGYDRFFTNSMIKEMNSKCKIAAKEIYDNPEKLINKYSNPEEVIAYLEPWLEELNMEDEVRNSIMASYANSINHFDRVKVEFLVNHTMPVGCGRIEITDGTCKNIYRVILENDMVHVMSFGESIFTDHIANPDSQQKFVEMMIKRHKL